MYSMFVSNIKINITVLNLPDETIETVISHVFHGHEVENLVAKSMRVGYESPVRAS